MSSFIYSGEGITFGGHFSPTQILIPHEIHFHCLMSLKPQWFAHLLSAGPGPGLGTQGGGLRVLAGRKLQGSGLEARLGAQREEGGSACTARGTRHSRGRLSWRPQGLPGREMGLGRGRQAAPGLPAEAGANGDLF